MWAQIDIPPLEVFGAGALALSILLWLVWQQHQAIKELQAKNDAWVSRTIDQFVPLVTETSSLLRQSTGVVVRQQELLESLRDQLNTVARDLREHEERIAREVVRSR